MTTTTMPAKRLLMLAPIAMLLCVFNACSSDDSETCSDAMCSNASNTSVGTSSTSNGQPDPDAVIQGETGLFFRDAVECFGADAMPSDSTAIYIAETGSDGNDGTSEETPFATLAKALCNAQSGQTIHVLPGRYTESVVIGNFEFDPSRPVHIMGQRDDNGDKPVFDGEQRLTFGIAAVGTKGLTIEDLSFRNYTDSGVRIDGSEQTTVRKCRFSNNGASPVEPGVSEGAGVDVVGSNAIMLEESVAFENGPAPSQPRAAGFRIFGSNTMVLTGNTARDNNGAGIFVDDGTAINMTANTITGNLLELDDGQWSGGVWLEGGHDIALGSNIISNNLGPGIAISDLDHKVPYGACLHQIIGNTIENNYWALYTSNYGQCPLPSEAILLIRSNTISGNMYPGAHPEDIANTDGENLCHAWPCGEESSCTDEMFDTSTRICP